MTTQEKRSLMDPVRECVLELQALGHYTTQDAVRLIRERYPERLQSFRERLEYDALAQLVRQVNKAPLPEQNGQAYLFLPKDVVKRLPQAISITTEGEDGSGQGWITLRDASLYELGIYNTLTQVRIQQDQRKLEATMELYDRLAPVMAGREHEPIGPVMEELGLEMPTA